jgi:hypothetical protein
MGANISNPVINGPFDEPWQHFELGSGGIIDVVVPHRGCSEYFIPVPQTKKVDKQRVADVPEITCSAHVDRVLGGPGRTCAVGEVRKRVRMRARCAEPICVLWKRGEHQGGSVRGADGSRAGAAPGRPRRGADECASVLPATDRGARTTVFFCLTDGEMLTSSTVGRS